MSHVPVRSFMLAAGLAAGVFLASSAAHADGSVKQSRETGSLTSTGDGEIPISATESVIVGAGGEVMVASRADPYDEAEMLIKGGWIAKYLIDEEGIWLFYKNGMMKMVPYTTQTMQTLTSTGIADAAAGATTAAGGGMAGAPVSGALGGTGMAIGGAVIAAEIAAVGYEAYLIWYYNQQRAAAEQQYIQMGGTQQQIDQNNQNTPSLYWYYFNQNYNPFSW